MRWMRLIVVLLSLTVGLGASLPFFARLIAGPKAHVCHCDTGMGHAYCACPICFPELEPDLGMIEVALKGRCGDDDTGWRTSSDPAVLPAGITLSVAPVTRLPSARVFEMDPIEVPAPDPRPPRV